MTAGNRVQHFFSQTPDSLKQFCAAHGMQGFVAAQMLEWVYRKGVVDPQAMTNISQRNREIIAEKFAFDVGRIVRHQVATDSTQKLLIEWPQSQTSSSDDETNEFNSRATAIIAGPIASLPLIDLGDAGDPNRQTECVMIPTDDRNTACVSSQVGCPVGCRFCASGLGGLDGNLTAGQIIEQVHRLARFESVDRISNVVFMGMGEPLANFANVTDAIRTLNALWAMGISARKITVSTVGLPAAIRKLVDFELPVTLALSLHAPNDELRRTLIPWAEYATIEELLDACNEYFHKTGREITLEYLLLRNVNDRPEHAHQLAGLARRLRANINLIRYNEVKGLPFDRPTTEDVRAFQGVLRDRHVNAHIRASRGRDIAAACGQLRHEHRGSPVASENR